MPYAEEHRQEKQAAATKRYSERHPERVRQQKQRWYEKNREKTRARLASWRKANPEASFNAHLKRKYGITREQYDLMLAAQGGVCAICGGTPVGKVKNGSMSVRFDVDHSHVTGQVRGLLCHPCNLMLGTARDNEANLQAAILYLRRTRV